MRQQRRSIHGVQVPLGEERDGALMVLGVGIGAEALVQFGIDGDEAEDHDQQHQRDSRCCFKQGMTGARIAV